MEKTKEWTKEELVCLKKLIQQYASLGKNVPTTVLAENFPKKSTQAVVAKCRAERERLKIYGKCKFLFFQKKMNLFFKFLVTTSESATFGSSGSTEQEIRQIVSSALSNQLDQRVENFSSATPTTLTPIAPPAFKTRRITAPYEHTAVLTEEIYDTGPRQSTHTPPYQPFMFRSNANNYLVVVWWRIDSRQTPGFQFRLDLEERNFSISFTVDPPQQEQFKFLENVIGGELVSLNSGRTITWDVTLPMGLSILCDPDQVIKINDHPQIFGFCAPVLRRGIRIQK